MRQVNILRIRQLIRRVILGLCLIVPVSQQAYAAQCAADYNAARNNHRGFYNPPVYPALSAFAALRDDGSIRVWGLNSSGGSGAPTDTGYISISSTETAFAAIKQTVA